MPTVPKITSPANNSVLTTAQLTEIDWTPSTGTYTPMVYQYQAFSDAAYTVLVYSSGWLTNNSIPTPGTPPGDYYVRVMAKDSMGNISDWSNGATPTYTPYKITVISLTLVDSPSMAFGSYGWAGWSCPTGKKIWSGSVTVITAEQSSVWKSGEFLGGATYPNTPFGYTYTPPEEGFIVQADVAGGNGVLHLMCY